MILIPILAIVLALSIDFAFGDPKNKYHPTVWAGKLVSKIVLLARFNSQQLEKLGGVMTVICVLVLISILIFSLSSVLQYLNNLELNGISKILVWALTVTVIGLLLKTTIAIKGMEQHASKIMEALSKNDLDDARAKLSMIVKRNTKNLDRQHIISATLESISENIVDGVAGPLDIRFEKLDHYVLGDGSSEITEAHFRSAISILKLTTILFVLLFTIPMIIVLSYLRWWSFV